MVLERAYKASNIIKRTTMSSEDKLKTILFNCYERLAGIQRNI